MAFGHVWVSLGKRRKAHGIAYITLNGKNLRFDDYEQDEYFLHLHKLFYRGNRKHFQSIPDPVTEILVEVWTNSK